MLLEKEVWSDSSEPLLVAPQNISEIQESVRSVDQGTIVPRGGGTCQHIGYDAVDKVMILSSVHLNKIVDLSPQDLFVTAQSGATVQSITDALLPYGLRLPFDVCLPQLRTIGGVISTRANSLRRALYGTLRDSVLGITVVDGDGEIVSAGGKVVKNVSGYDLSKLYCGAFGTLGFVADATFRVVPVPEFATVVCVHLPADRNSEETLDHLIRSRIQPSFLYLLNADAAKRSQFPGYAGSTQAIVIGLDGSKSDVQWQLELLGAENEVMSESDNISIREQLRDIPLQPADLTVSFHIMSSQVGAFSRMIEWTAEKNGFSADVYSDAVCGIMTAHFHAPESEPRWLKLYAAIRDKSLRCGGSVVFERIPDALRQADVDIWAPILNDASIMRRLKSSLDPESRWNNGRFYNRM